MLYHKTLCKNNRNNHTIQKKYVKKDYMFEFV